MRVSTAGTSGAGVVHRRARAGFGILVAAFIALGAVAPIVATAASAAPADTIYSLVNQARAAAGLPGFLHNQSIDVVATNWANQMGANAAMTHNPQYSAQIPGGWTRAGENVAQGYPTPQAMFTGWMDSPGHRANILGDYTDIGIAFVTVNGQTWGVQDFGKYPGHVGPAAPAPAPAPAPAAPAPVPAPPVPAAPRAAAPAPVGPAAPAPALAPAPAAPAVSSPTASAKAQPSSTSPTHKVSSSMPSAAPASSAPAGTNAPDAREQAGQTTALPTTAAAAAAVAIGFVFWSTLWRRTRSASRRTHH